MDWEKFTGRLGALSWKLAAESPAGRIFVPEQEVDLYLLSDENDWDEIADHIEVAKVDIASFNYGEITFPGLSGPNGLGLFMFPIGDGYWCLRDDPGEGSERAVAPLQPQVEQVLLIEFFRDYVVGGHGCPWRSGPGQPASFWTRFPQEVEKELVRAFVNESAAWGWDLLISQFPSVCSSDKDVDSLSDEEAEALLDVYLAHGHASDART